MAIRKSFAFVGEMGRNSHRQAASRDVYWIVGVLDSAVRRWLDLCRIVKDLCAAVGLGVVQQGRSHTGALGGGKWERSKTSSRLVSFC